MASRKSTKVVETGLRQKNEGSAKNPYVDMYRFWRDLSAMYGKQFSGNAKDDGQSAEMFRRWAQFYADATSGISDAMKSARPDDLQALTNAMNDYGTRMGMAINKMVMDSLGMKMFQPAASINGDFSSYISEQGKMLAELRKMAQQYARDSGSMLGSAGWPQGADQDWYKAYSDAADLILKAYADSLEAFTRDRSKSE